jgi:hypothetical protein
MKSTHPMLQKAILPLAGSVVLIAIGVRALYKGIVLQQPWRVGLSVVGITFFVAIIIMVLVALLRKDKPGKA